MSVNFPVFKIADWFISLEKLDKSHLSKNPCACHLLKKNQEWIDWNELSANPNAMELLMMNKNKINWDKFNQNTNPEAIAFLKKNPSKRRWVILSENTEALEIINENIHNVNWTMLSMNSNAIEILKENENKLRFTIAANKNPQALPLIQRFYEKLLKEGSSLEMFFLYLSSNPIATDLILANIQEMNCGGLCENTSDIILNYLKENPLCSS